MPYAAVNGLRMYYEVHGPPDGPPLLLLHGFTGTGRMWQAQVASFRATYRVVVPDLRSHGRTDNPGGLAAMNHRQFGRDIVALCQELRLERPILVGHSTGGMLQLTIGVEAPELPRALVLSASTYFYSEELRAGWRSRTPETHVRPEQREAIQATHTAIGAESWRQLAQAFLALGDHTPEEDFPVPTELRQIRVPTLILHGDRDNLFPVAVPVALYGLIPGTELAILPNAGHNLVHARPEWWRDIVHDFLRRRAGGDTAGSAPLD